MLRFAAIGDGETGRLANDVTDDVVDDDDEEDEGAGIAAPIARNCQNQDYMFIVFFFKIT